MPPFEAAEVRCQFWTTAGNAVSQILNVAKTEAVDLIVLGSRGLGAFRSLLLGSVSEGANSVI